jgi:Spy/CpxP family protein refolding chaperone
VSTSPRAVAALLIVAALIAGIVVGVAGDRAYLLYTRRMAPHPPRFLSDRLVEHLDHELQFTPQQRDAVKQIIEHHRQRIQAISDGIRPQMRQELDATNAEIEKVLNPDQQKKFRELSSRMHRRHGSRGMSPVPPPPQP